MFLSKQYAHWHQYFENLNVSSKEFYESLGSELNNGHLPQTKLSQVEFPEGGILSSKRTYLEVRRDWLTYHICVALLARASSHLPGCSCPLGIPGGRMVTFALILILAEVLVCVGVEFLTHNLALALLSGLVCGVPLAGIFLISLISWVYKCLHMTYYRLDTMLAFHEAIHSRLIVRLNDLLDAGGKRPSAKNKPSRSCIACSNARFEKGNDRDCRTLHGFDWRKADPPVLRLGEARSRLARF